VGHPGWKLKVGVEGSVPDVCLEGHPENLLQGVVLGGTDAQLRIRGIQRYGITIPRMAL